MKNLYIWNDIELFYGSEILNFDKDLLRILRGVSSDISVHYIISESFNRWMDKELNKIKDNKVISIGTRPNLYFKSHKHNSIFFDRVIDRNGKSAEITFRGNSENILKEICQSENEIHFLEDVLVGGNTIKYLCEFIHSLNKPNLKVVFHIFYANKLSIDKLKSEWKNFHFDLGHMMEGTPIAESTLICVYDLMYGTINNKPYIENSHLLENFFGDKTVELSKLIKTKRRCFDERTKTIT